MAYAMLSPSTSQRIPREQSLYISPLTYYQRPCFPLPSTSPLV